MCQNLKVCMTPNQQLLLPRTAARLGRVHARHKRSAGFKSSHRQKEKDGGREK